MTIMNEKIYIYILLKISNSFQIKNNNAKL